MKLFKWLIPGGKDNCFYSKAGLEFSGVLVVIAAPDVDTAKDLAKKTLTEEGRSDDWHGFLEKEPEVFDLNDIANGAPHIIGWLQ